MSLIREGGDIAFLTEGEDGSKLEFFFILGLFGVVGSSVVESKVVLVMFLSTWQDRSLDNFVPAIE